MSRIGEAMAPDLFAPVRASFYPKDVPVEVCDLFEKLALEVHARGFKRYSARAILHRIRWHEQIERGNDGFKVNNNVTPALARWFIARHPTLSDFFELRESPE